MIMSIDGSDLEPGDHVVITRKVVKTLQQGNMKKVRLEDGTEFEVTESTSIEISTHEIKVTR